MSTTEPSAASGSTPISGDPTKHCTVLEVLQHGNKEYKCNHCSSEFKGTATRCYIHLTGDGKGVSRCTAVPEALVTALKAAKAAKEAEAARKRQAQEAAAAVKRARRDSTASAGSTAAAAAAAGGCGGSLPGPVRLVPDWATAGIGLSGLHA